MAHGLMKDPDPKIAPRAGEAATLTHALGRRIPVLRAEHGWSQETLSALTGLHRTYLSQVERGSLHISVIQLAKIAHAFALRPGVLIDSSVAHAPVLSHLRHDPELCGGSRRPEVDPPSRSRSLPHPPDRRPDTLEYSASPLRTALSFKRTPSGPNPSLKQTQRGTGGPPAPMHSDKFPSRPKNTADHPPHTETPRAALQRRAPE